MVISNLYSPSKITQWSIEEENNFSFYIYPLARVIMVWWRPRLWAETSRSLLSVFKKCVGCNWRFFRSVWMICQQGCSIRSLCHSCFKRPAYHHSPVICTYSDLIGHAERRHDVSILTPPTIVVSRLLGCDTVAGRVRPDVSKACNVFSQKEAGQEQPSGTKTSQWRW